MWPSKLDQSHLSIKRISKWYNKCGNNKHKPASEAPTMQPQCADEVWYHGKT
uniref:Uncharacterized protein n=1 Tax=Arion vulgaris TaxID=1028688 RepID=A0A0B7AFB9_9EUPU